MLTDAGKGYCKPRFAAVEDVFEKNFLQRGEVGASLCILVDGEIQAHLWAGYADHEANRPWAENTISNVFSCTKGALALCAHMLADAGELDFDKPISHYWPEFAQQGKSSIPVRMILNHQIGLPAIRQPINREQLYQLNVLPQMLAEEAPFWQPGTQHGYHALTFGALLDELFRRICGQGIGEYFQQEVATPMELEFWLGLPEDQEHRVASLILPQPEMRAPNSVPLESTVDYVRRSLEVFMGDIVSREFRAAGIPAGGGVGSALALARMYAPLSLDGSFERKRLVSESRIDAMSYARSCLEQDAILNIATCFTTGFAKSWSVGSVQEGLGYAIGERAFGHPGMGGSIAFADPQQRLSFAYTTNRMNGLPTLDYRAQALIDAVYRVLGLSDRELGFWR